MDFDLISEFNAEMEHVSFDVLGLIDSAQNIHTLGTDSKVLGRIFEMLVQPVLERIAKRHGLLLETPTAQTLYPDFILTKSKESTEKIAIDVKTTYRRYTQNGALRKFTYTLGSYASYMRNGSKNIAYHYGEFIKHYVICFLYDRNGLAQESRLFNISQIDQIQPPYRNIEYFIQEKYKIAGEKPGSGDTENIGSFPTNDISLLAEGRGCFSDLGEDIYDLYWKHYPKYRSPIKEYTNLNEFCVWFLEQKTAPTLFRGYNYEEVVKKLRKWQRKNG